MIASADLVMTRMRKHTENPPGGPPFRLFGSAALHMRLTREDMEAAMNGVTQLRIQDKSMACASLNGSNRTVGRVVRRDVRSPAGVRRPAGLGKAKPGGLCGEASGFRGSDGFGFDSGR
jgi:hypothetical protein